MRLLLLLPQLQHATPDLMTLDPTNGHYLRTLLDRSPMGILVANDAATYVDVNAAACQFLKGKREEILGRNLADFLRPGHAAQAATQWRAFLRDGRQSGVLELRRLDGGYQTVHFHAEANFQPGLHCSFLTAVPEPISSVSDLLTLCAWTKQVCIDDEWMPLEDYFVRAHGKSVSHGISPQAYDQFFPGSGGSKNL
jgi:PAS domain S-box-containing protein